jgi:hypothetical protein
MTRRIWTAIAGCAVAAALVAVPSALAAYTSAKLEVTQTGNVARIKASLSGDADPTASVRIFVPSGTSLTTSQTPGTVLGPVEALVKALDLGGADLPLTGQVVVAAPGQIPLGAQAACIGSTTPLSSWVLVLTAAGQTLTVPAYLLATSGALTSLGPAFIQVCLPPPDVPAGTPGRATFGAKLYSATLTVQGVFGAVPSGAWISFWTPYNVGVGTPNVAGTVVAPAAVAPGSVALAARRSGRGAIVTGRVTQGGQARGGATVTISGGPRAGSLRRLGRARVTASGTFTFRARTGTFFRATAVAPAATAPALCTTLAPLFAALGNPPPCLNPTTNGFTAQSRTIRKR